MDAERRQLTEWRQRLDDEQRNLISQQTNFTKEKLGWHSKSEVVPSPLSHSFAFSFALVNLFLNV